MWLLLFPRLAVPLFLIFVVWLVLLIDFIERRKKITLYLLIFLSLSIILSNLYNCVFDIIIPNPFEKHYLFFAGSWVCNILYQLVCSIITIKSGLLYRSENRQILFGIFIVFTTATFYFITSVFYSFCYTF